MLSREVADFDQRLMNVSEEVHGVFGEIKSGLNDFMLNIGSKNIPLTAKSVFLKMWEELVLRLYPITKKFRPLDPDFPFIWLNYENEAERQKDLNNLLRETYKTESSESSSQTGSAEEETRPRENSIANPSEKSVLGSGKNLARDVHRKRQSKFADLSKVAKTMNYVRQASMKFLGSMSKLKE